MSVFGVLGMNPSSALVVKWAHHLDLIVFQRPIGVLYSQKEVHFVLRQQQVSKLEILTSLLECHFGSVHMGSLWNTSPVQPNEP